MTTERRFSWWAVAVWAIGLGSLASTAACRGSAANRSEGVVLTVWRHESGEPELSASLAALARFDRAHDDVELDIQTLPQGSYTEAVTASALAGKLPCVLDVDQPTVPNFAWSGHLRALDDLLPRAALAGLMPGATSRYRGRLYAVGQFDVVVALFARRSRLEALGARVATLNEPYRPAELRAILVKAKTERPETHPLDLGLVHRGEWLPYAFGPWLVSAGGGLLDPDDPWSAEGVLNGPGAVSVARWVQGLVDDGLVDPHPVDDRAFLQDRAIMHYAGSWMADRFRRAIGADLLVMPPPDFGEGPKIGSGSWQWGITRSCPHPGEAARLLRHLISNEEIAHISRAASFVPVSAAAARLTEDFAPGGTWRSFYDFAASMAVARPASPGYPKISATFEKAWLDIVSGAPPQATLDAAVDAIEFDVARNRGYGFERRRR